MREREEQKEAAVRYVIEIDYLLKGKPLVVRTFYYSSELPDTNCFKGGLSSSMVKIKDRIVDHLLHHFCGRKQIITEIPGSRYK